MVAWFRDPDGNLISDRSVWMSAHRSLDYDGACRADVAHIEVSELLREPGWPGKFEDPRH